MMNSPPLQPDLTGVTDTQLLDAILSILDDIQIAALKKAIAPETPLGTALRSRLNKLAKNADAKNEPSIQQQIQARLQADDDQFNSSFFKELDKMMQKRNISDPELYNKIGISQALWANIRSKGLRDSGSHIRDAHTKRENVLKMAIVLKADYYELYNLMCYSGFSFSPSTSLGDHIIACCVKAKIYEPDRINQYLMDNNMEPLFGDK